MITKTEETQQNKAITYLDQVKDHDSMVQNTADVDTRFTNLKETMIYQRMCFSKINCANPGADPWWGGSRNFPR